MTTYYKSLFDLVREFHEAYEMPVGTVNIHNDFDKITKEDSERIALRSNLVAEEFKELINAESCEEIMKESCDLIYVILGTFVEFGWDLEEAFRRVHQSNMSKLGEDGKPLYREDGKVLKGPNYFKPELSDLV